MHRHGAEGSPGVRHQAEEGGEDEGDPRAGSLSPGLILINQTLGSSLTVIDNRLIVNENADPLYETPARFLSLVSHLGKRSRGGETNSANKACKVAGF